MALNQWSTNGSNYPLEILDTSKILENKSTHGVKIIGNLEVISVEGPYYKSNPEKKAESVSRNHGYYYFATIKNLNLKNLKKIKWAISYDGFGNQQSFFLFNGGTIVDGKLRVEIQSKKAKDKFKIYAYVGNIPSDNIYCEVFFKKSINLFIGGAADKEPFGPFPKTNNILNGVKVPYEKTLDETTKLDYISAYLSYKDAYKKKIDSVIIPILKNKSHCQINIIGHSLGAWNGAHLSINLADRGYKIGLFASLDPVGTGGLVTSFSDIYIKTAFPSKLYWINILAGSLSDDSDFVAALGGRWVPPISWVDTFQRTEYSHAKSYQMFFESFPKNTFNPKDFLDVYIDLLYLSAE